MQQNTSEALSLESALYGGNALFVQELYSQYVSNPNSVDASWRSFFSTFQDDANHVLRETRGENWNPKLASVIGVVSGDVIVPKAQAGKKGQQSAEVSDEILRATALDSVRALMIIRAYRVRGHLNANLDPLGLSNRTEIHPELNPASYGFEAEDYDRPIFLGGVLGLQQANLKEIMSLLQATYCGNIGYEFMHIEFPEQKAWIQERAEAILGKPRLSLDEKKRTFKDIAEVEAFESFLQLKYPSTKRFSVQGGDAAISGLLQSILTASDLGVEEIVLGMPHRGRMNVLTTVMGKPYVELLSIFHGNMDVPDSVYTSGDVKYHLGVSNDKPLSNGKTIHLSLTANPSHLEAVNPVVLGKVRAKQDQRKDTAKSKVMPILLHGDAAFAGQGLVAEVLTLCDLKGYRVGGTVHIIINNQIGFTTSPASQRSSPYPSDVAKGVQAPIFHVNGSDPEAVAFVCKMATEFRQQFKRDVVIDIVCFRKYGHNESDEPAFTQPKMYASIAKQKMPARMYAERLVAEGTLSDADVEKQFKDFRDLFDKEFEAAKSYKPNKADWLGGFWSGYERPKGEFPEAQTGVDKKTLLEIGSAITSVPANFQANKKIIRQLEAKKEAIESGKGIDWATAEALAFGSSLIQGSSIRFTGQDVRRGTFSQRHAVLIDQENEETYTMLNHIKDGQKQLEIYDSNLSEYAILGYEYGYSLSEPNALVLWEAQFGDFSNGAQVIIDQFISSGEIKWLRMSGLVMLLPHGYEGQGPEHSSARLERYLQLCAQDNMIVANCSTPANYFHILRRQVVWNFRKPLVMVTPKSLLRHKLCVSDLAEMSEKTVFKPVLGETQKLDESKVRKVVICSGKVYYDILEEREKLGKKDVAIVRLEQFYPFPSGKMEAELKKYSKAEFVWCQEEPKNMGAWTFVAPYLEEVISKVKGKFARAEYAGRPAAASPATGYAKIHEQEQKSLVADALS